MRINQAPSGGADLNHACRLQILLLVPLLLIAAGCGRSDGGKSSGKESSIQPKPSPAVKKLSPEAARMELAKLNKDFRPEAFIASAVNGDKVAVEVFLAAGMNVNAKNREGLTALMAACEGGHVDIAAILVSRGSDVSAQSVLGETAIMFAAKGGHDDLVRRLLQNNADPKATDAKGVPPLSYAAAGGHTKAMGLLIEKGASVNDQSASGTTALMYAAKGGSMDAVKFLIDHGAKVEMKDASGQTAMDWAGDNAGVRAWLRVGGAKPVTDDTFPKLLVEQWHHASAILGIIMRSRDEPTFDEKALAPIRAYYSDELVDALRQKGFTDCQIAQMVWPAYDQLRAGIKTTRMVWGMDRAASGTKESLTDTQRKFHNTLVKHAKDSWEVFEKVFLASLESKWSQPDVRLGMGCEAVFFLDGSRDVRCGTTNITPLMLAAWLGRTNMVAKLLEKGADADARDSGGQTALEWAAQQKEAAELLRAVRGKALTPPKQ